MCTRENNRESKEGRAQLILSRACAFIFSSACGGSLATRQLLNSRALTLKFLRGEVRELVHSVHGRATVLSFKIIQLLLTLQARLWEGGGEGGGGAHHH